MDLTDRTLKDSNKIYKLGANLTASQQNQIHQLMEEFRHVMASSFKDIKGSKLKYQHDVDTGDHKPIKS